MRKAGFWMYLKPHYFSFKKISQWRDIKNYWYESFQIQIILKMWGEKVKFACKEVKNRTCPNPWLSSSKRSLVYSQPFHFKKIFPAQLLLSTINLPGSQLLPQLMHSTIRTQGFCSAFVNQDQAYSQKFWNVLGPLGCKTWSLSKVSMLSAGVGSLAQHV